MNHKAVVATVLALAPLAALGQLTTAQPVVIGANYTVNASPGTQTDPHVWGDTVAYSNYNNTPGEIRYYDLATGTDAVIPGTSDKDYLSDVSGTQIVFTRISGSESNIYLFDTTTGSSTLLSPTPGAFRNSASIGGNTVAWVDFTNSGTTFASEVVVYDIANGTTTSLTPGTSLTNAEPDVSQDGSVVTFTSCTADGLNCDVNVATNSGGVWTTTSITDPSPGTVERLPATDGTLVAYEATPAGGTTADTDIAYQTIGSPTVTTIPLPGSQNNPTVADGLIAFESAGNGGTTDLFLYDTATSTLYQLTNTPQTETLSDIYVAPDGLVRVTYVRDDGTAGVFDYNVYAFSFYIEQPTNTCTPSDDGSGSGDDGDDDGDHDGHCHGHHHHHDHHHGHHHHGHWGNGHSGNGSGSTSSTHCANPGNRPVLATLTLNRTTGAPNTGSTSFSATAGNGLLCVTNNQATSGKVTLNGSEEVGSSAFKHSVTSIERLITLNTSNTLSGKIAGQPGTSYTVTVYGSDPDTCEDEQPSLAGSAFRVKNVGDAEVHSIQGQPAPSLDLANDSELPAQVGDSAAQPAPVGTIHGESFGCASTGTSTGAVMLALLALGGLLFRARPATVKVRAHRE